MSRPEIAGRKLTARNICDRYGIVDKTVERWVDAGILPQPVYINKRRYFDEAEVEQRERERMAAREAV
jgi:predicted site-specific integrase-resolvase